MPQRVARRVGTAVGVVLVLGLLAGAVLWLGPPLREALTPPPPEACTEDDPTGAGCLTPSAAALHGAVVARFGEPGTGAPIRSATCWSEHAWNPASDHPAGRACDYFPGASGEFATGEELAAGWAVANHLRENASALRVRYVIWQGRIWYRGTGDTDAWGRPYDGGGVYDAADATGGHFDHVHVSVRA